MRIHVLLSRVDKFVLLFDGGLGAIYCRQTWPSSCRLRLTNRRLRGLNRKPISPRSILQCLIPGSNFARNVTMRRRVFYVFPTPAGAHKFTTCWRGACPKTSRLALSSCQGAGIVDKNPC